MDILSGILDLFTGGVAGGILGLVGSWLAAREKRAQLREERAFEEKKWKYDLDLQQLNMQARAQETEQELAIVSQEGAWTGLERSTQHDTMLIEHSSSWVNNIRSLYRPILTSVLQAGCIWIIWLIATGNETATQILIAPANPVADLLRYAVYSWVFAAQTSTVWWFGDRAFAPPGMKNR